MITESMTPEERIRAAINLQQPDRVPVMPLGHMGFAAHHKGIIAAEFIKNIEKVRQAMVDVFDELGGFDGIIAPGVSFVFPPRLSAIVTSPLYEVPGVGLAEDSQLQYNEREILTADDYDRIISLGWGAFAEKHYDQFIKFQHSQIIAWAEKQTKRYLEDIELWNKKGIPCYQGAVIYSPLMFFSMFRTLTQFTLDLHRQPDKVAAAMDAVVDDFIKDGIETVRMTGLPWVMLVLERGGCFYYPLKIFERFEFPYMKKMVNAWADEGIVPLLHFDQDWTLNLPYLKELPRGKCICELDSTTDIFKAKEILRDHMCIMGDVPASLQALGTPQEMKEYCEKLIDVIGDGGGYILSSGCAVPIDAKFENVKAMIDTAKNHLPAH